MKFSRCKTIKEFINCFNDKQYRDDPNVSNFDLDEYDDVFFLNGYKFKLSGKFNKRFYSKFANIPDEEFKKSQADENSWDTRTDDSLNYGFANEKNTFLFKRKNNIVTLKCFEYDGITEFDCVEYRRIFVKSEIPLRCLNGLFKQLF